MSSVLLFAVFNRNYVEKVNIFDTHTVHYRIYDLILNWNVWLDYPFFMLLCMYVGKWVIRTDRQVSHKHVEYILGTNTHK